jgi:hypothetical protein
MLDLETIRSALQDRRLDKVSEATGLHRNTVMLVRDQPHRNPSWQTLKALSDYLQGQSAKQ